MQFLILILFNFIDFISFLSGFRLVQWFKNLSFNFIKKQIVLMLSIFLISILFLNTNIKMAMNLAQPSFFDLIFGSTGVSVLSHCNSSSELLMFTFLVGGSCLTYNWLFESYALKLAHTATVEHITSTPIFGPEPLLSSTAQRANLNREDLLALVNLYNDQVQSFIRRINHNQAYDLHYVKDFLKLSNYQYLYGLLFRDHKLLHEKLLPHINPECFTNYVQIPNALSGKEFISWNLVAKLNNTSVQQITLSDLYGVVSERLFQLHGEKCIPLVIIPDLIHPTLPIVGSQINRVTQVLYIPTTYTNIWEQYVVSSYNTLTTFFFWING